LSVPETLTTAARPAASRFAWWVRVTAALPLGFLYTVTAVVGWLAYRVFPYREPVVRENLSIAFPDLDETGLRRLMRQYYANFAQVLAEVIKSPRIAPLELRQRVRIISADEVREALGQGRPVLLVAAHQCNWEWLLLALALELGYPVDAAYKPLVDVWAEREMLKVRTRFGSRLVPANDLLPDIIKRRQVVRAIAMVADQEPTKSEHKHWTRFLNRDSAFFLGAEEIARVTRYPTFFVGMRRLARGRYEIEFTPLATGRESLSAGELTERYAKRVEAQIRAAPADWPWSHKRWRLKKSLYAR
jgi:Kdo2-lipid IVA lauroyltransferase/acyltransferase